MFLNFFESLYDGIGDDEVDDDDDENNFKILMERYVFERNFDCLFLMLLEEEV